MTDFLLAALRTLSSGASAPVLALLTERTAEVARVMNITSRTSEAEIVFYHIADSLSLLEIPALAQAKSVLDVGTGGGFPGLALAAVLPDTEFTLLDATEKKIAAIEETVARLQLSNVHTLCGRAETFAHERAFRSSFDAVVSRAVAPTAILAELCIPFLRRGGVFLAPKGKKAAEELAAAKPAISALGARLSARKQVSESEHRFLLGEALPTEDERATLRQFCEMTREILVFEKCDDTKDLYPRPFAQIKKGF